MAAMLNVPELDAIAFKHKRLLWDYGTSREEWMIIRY